MNHMFAKKTNAEVNQLALLITREHYYLHVSVQVWEFIAFLSPAKSPSCTMHYYHHTTAASCMAQATKHSHVMVQPSKKSYSRVVCYTRKHTLSQMKL
jgi:hypothetical protein